MRRDGEDLFVTNIIAETFALYTNDGHGFSGHARQSGLAQPTAVLSGLAQAGSTTTTTGGWTCSSPTAQS
jgi:hypothetical protein